jgi:alanine dehydrogenase
MTDAAVVLSARDVSRLLTFDACIDAVARVMVAHEQGRSRGPVSSGLTLADGSVHAKMAAIDHGGRSYIAVKANVNLPANPVKHGRPTIQGVLILLDAVDGRPLAIMDSIALTSIRTAGVAALAARHLAIAEATTITIVGSGEQGEAQLRAMTRVRALQLAMVIDADRGKAVAFADRMSKALGFPVVATTDLDEAMAASQICVTCTTSRQPMVFRHHLHAGLFIAAVGADNPAKQEIDADALSHSRVVVDSLAACAAGGDLHHAIRATLMTEQDIHGELSAIVTGGRPGRRTPEEVFVFDSTGTALQDVAAAVLVYSSAVEAGVGMRVVLDDREIVRAS